jgi:sarcosine oxidase subunit alpha
MRPRVRLTAHPDFPLPVDPERGAFSFDGRRIPFRERDTIASALYAAGVDLFSRSFKYHRPRSLYDGHGFGADVLVTVDGAPNVLADRAPAREGIDVRSQNAWPSLGFDLLALNDVVVPLLPNGFYYKMFHKPRWLWPIAERGLRRAAGLGRIDVSGRDAERRYEKRYRFPDVCVVGGGPAGLAAALSAAEAGRQVLLLESRPELGGHALCDLQCVTFREAPGATALADLDGLAAHEAVARLAARVSAAASIEVLAGATAFAVYEDNYVAAQRGSDLFKVRAEAVVVANGASDRHLVFERNDLPGIVTGRAVERLVCRHAIRPGARAVVVTAHAGGYRIARLLHGAGTAVAGVVDGRPDPGSDEAVEAVRRLGIRILPGRSVHAAVGRRRLRAVEVGPVAGAGRERIDCDLAVIAAGFSPQLSLLAMGRGKPRWDAERGVFRAPELPAGLYAAGEVNGPARTGRLLREGWDVGAAAAQGRPAPASARAPEDAVWLLPPDVDRGGSKHFVCRCMDVTRAEMRCSIAEGYDQLETLKRFTSLGMGHCQGKTCYEAAARILALEAGAPADEAEPTTMRPPFVPVSFGVLAGRAPHLRVVRRTPMHGRHAERGARFLHAGAWLRPADYGDAAAEARAVREGLGLIDVSTLGKLELSGRDAAALLGFLLPRPVDRLAPGRVRYHTMVREDGVLYEDGTTSHLEPGTYYVSTTTGNADAIYADMAWWIERRRLDVQLRNLGPALAAVNLSGMGSRDLLQPFVDVDLSNAAFPYMSCRSARLADVPVRLFRIGFTGELSYEIHFPAEYGESLWDWLLERGQPHGLTPFGVEAQRILRLEKGHLIPGVDTDALTSPFGAGVGFTCEVGDRDFVGRAFLARERGQAPRDRLVSFRLAPGTPVPDDGVLVFAEDRMIGRVTSARASPALGTGIGLAWVAASHAAAGTRLRIRLADGRDVSGEVIAQAPYDPDGKRLRG